MSQQATDSGDAKSGVGAKEAPCSSVTDFLESGAELGLGTAILAVRRFNVWRRHLASTAPPAAEFVETSVDAFTDAATMVSTEVSSVMKSSLGHVPGPAKPVVEVVGDVAAAVPDLLRISGLATPR